MKLEQEKKKDLAYVVEVTHIDDLKGIKKSGDKISIKPRQLAPLKSEMQVRLAGSSVGTASPASDPAPVLIALNGIVTIESKDCSARHMLYRRFYC